MTFVAYHFGYLLRHLLNRLINLRLVTGGASLPGASRDPPLTNAITGIGGCCARAASGHAAPPKFIRPKFERMPVELKQLKNWVLLVPIRKDRSGQNAQSNRRDSAQAGRSAARLRRQGRIQETDDRGAELGAWAAHCSRSLERAALLQ